MLNIRFDIKAFTKQNPQATKEDLLSALKLAPKIYCGITELDVLEYLAGKKDNKDDNCHIFIENQVIPLLPDIMFYLEQHASMKSGVTWSDIDTAHKVILSR